jgi:exodeoxyribonuclease-5
MTKQDILQEVATSKWQPDVDLKEFTPNNPIFNMIGKPLLNYYDLIIIDECSMLNDKLLEYIEQISNTKILFVGDSSQLKPVNQENVSKCFSFSKSALSTIMRTKESEILEISQLVRENKFNIQDFKHLCISGMDDITTDSKILVLVYGIS